MLHQIKSEGRYRETLVNLQQTGKDILLAISNANGSQDAKEVVLTLDQHFEGFGQWLSRKPDSIIELVDAILKIKRQNTVMFEQMMQVLASDHGFSDCDENTFEFKWSTLPDEIKKPVGKLFINLYEILLGQGDYRIKRFGDIGTFGKKELVNAFHESNLRYEQVCSACDGRNVEQVEGVPRAHDDLDHYFPKKKYPILAVSPDNLVPVCLHCNSCFKEETDPVEGLSKGCLEDVFLPYSRPAYNQICFDFEYEQKDTYPKLFIKPNTSADSKVEERIKRMNSTLHLENRWRFRMRVLMPELHSLIGLFKKGLQPEEVSNERLVGQLQTYLEDVILPHVGKNPDFYIKARLYEWAIANYAVIFRDSK